MPADECAEFGEAARAVALLIELPGGRQRQEFPAHEEAAANHEVVIGRLELEEKQFAATDRREPAFVLRPPEVHFGLLGMSAQELVPVMVGDADEATHASIVAERQ